MGEALILLFELAINIFESCLLIEFITKFNGCKYEGIKQRIMFLTTVVLLFADVSMSNYVDVPIEIPSYIAIAIMIIYSMTALKGHPLIKIYSCILINVILILTNGCYIFIFGIIFNVSVDSMMVTSEAHRFVLFLSSKITLFYISRIILKFRSGNYKKVPDSSWILITVIPMLTIFIMVTITESAVYNNDKRRTFYLLLSIFGLIAANVIFYRIFMKSVKDYEISTENRLLKQNIKLQEKHSVELKNLYTEIQTIRHNMKNQLLGIRTFIEDKNNDRALNYINSLIENIELTKKFVFTKNDMFNAIINNKFSEANYKGIKTGYNISYEVVDLIEDADINILFGNLLDNAIEACEKLTDNKQIHLSIMKKRGYISIQVKNTIANSVLQDNPELLTDKPDKLNHGMGIRSIRKTVEKYDGIIDFTENGNTFICDILLLGKNNKNTCQVY